MFLCINDTKNTNIEWIGLLLLVLFVIAISFSISEIINILDSNSKTRKSFINKLIPWLVATVILGIAFFISYKDVNDLSVNIGMVIIFLIFASFIETIKFIIKAIMSDKNNRKKCLHRLLVWVGILFICGALYAIFYASQGASGPWANVWC